MKTFLTEEQKAGESITARDDFFISEQTVAAVSLQVDLLEIERFLFETHTGNKRSVFNPDFPPKGESL